MTAVPSDATSLPTDPPSAAETYASLGWRVIPIAPGKKYPQLPAWQDAATDDLPTIRNWYTNLYRGHGVGIATGEGSDLWVLDVDIADGKQGAQSLAALQNEHEPLPPTVMAITGTGGLHLYFQWDSDRPITNGTATNLPPGLDIRGTGGQVVAAPTTHPDTSQPYRWADRRDPWSIPVADAPDWLYTLLLAGLPGNGGDQAPAASTASQAAGATPDSDSIAEWARSQHHFPDLLTTDGWTHHSNHGDDTWWTRPGKNPRQGHSAVLHGDEGPLVIFTTEVTSELVTAGTATADGSGVSVSLFGYLAGTRHHGDRSACARHYRIERNRLEGRGPATGPIDAHQLIGATDGTAAIAPAATPLQAVPELPNRQDFTDLTTWWDNPEPARPADTLTRTDGTGLLYLDQLNWIHGDSGSGKTWVLLHAAHQLITQGLHVAWVHYEDPNPATIIGRLKLLGAARTDVLEYFHYWDPQGEPLAAPALLEACTALSVAHIGIDSIGEALNAAGRNEDSDHEVGPWISGGPRALVNHGIGVTCLDHGTKDAKTAPLHPSGSKRKRAAITGAGLLIRAEIPPTRTSDGRMQIICGKDRHGNHPHGQVIGTANLRHNITTGGIDFTITAPGGDQADTGHDKRVREVVRLVEADPGINRNAIARLMSSASATRKKTAVDTAIESGQIRVEIGARKSQELHPND